MYLHQAMREPDKDKFKEAMTKEINDHTTRKHWSLHKKSSIPNDKLKDNVITGVWSMKRKRIPGTGIISKYKARLCANGSQQHEGVNYWDTYAPVVKWLSVRIMLTLTIIEQLHS